LRGFAERRCGEGGLTVVLDIDECLVHTTFEDDYNFRQKEYRPDAVKAIDQIEITMSDGERARVNKRPGLDRFLKAVLEEFDTYTYTAAMEIYARPLMDKLDTEKGLRGRYYRQDCRYHEGLYLKDLDIVEKADPKRVVLVDNNPVSFLLQPDNGIPVSSFYDQADDEELEAVLQVLRLLSAEEDVRPVLREMYQLGEQLRPLSRRLLRDSP